MRSNRLTTIAGIMITIGTIPAAVTASHISFPLWWNACQFPLILIGLVGAALLGFASKGQDEHSTESQVNIATAKSVVNAAANAVEKETKTSGG